MSPWKARMKHVFTPTVLIPNAHTMEREPTQMHSVGSLLIHCIQPSENTHLNSKGEIRKIKMIAKYSDKGHVRT